MDTTVVKRLQIFSGDQHRVLAEKVAQRLGVEVSDAQMQYFANGEMKCQLSESVRGADIFVFQTHSAPVNDALMEQAIIIDAAKRASARHITAVCPLLGYARQDRKSAGREPITSKLVVDLLSVAGADRIVSIDLHTGQIQGFFDGPFDHLVAMPVLVEYLKKSYGRDFVIVSPDAGRVKSAERYADLLGVDIAVVHKSRPRNNQAVVKLDVIGDVKNKRCVIVDDMIDTAGTICAAAAQLKKHGAASIVAIATHGLLSSPAGERLGESVIDRVIVTDTVPLPNDPLLPEIEVVSVVELLANAINAIFQEQSVSEIFGGQNQA